MRSQKCYKGVKIHISVFINKFYWHCQGHNYAFLEYTFVHQKSCLWGCILFDSGSINLSWREINNNKSMLTSEILHHCPSQQLRRNWTSYKKKWKLLHCETTTPSNIYHIKFMQNVDLMKKFIGIETNDNYNETIKFEWDLYLSVLS